MSVSEELYVTVSKATPQEWPHIVEIARQELGRDYIHEEQLRNYELMGSTMLIARNARLGILGFCISYKESLSELRMEFGLKDFDSAVAEVAVLKTIAVVSDYHRRGIGSALLTEVIQAIGEANVPAISIGWKRKTGVAIEKLLTKNAFRRFSEIENFWQEESLIKGFHCPDCGSPCVCSAIVFVRDL